MTASFALGTFIFPARKIDFFCVIFFLTSHSRIESMKSCRLFFIPGFISTFAPKQEACRSTTASWQAVIAELAVRNYQRYAAVAAPKWTS